MRCRHITARRAFIAAHQPNTSPTGVEKRAWSNARAAVHCGVYPVTSALDAAQYGERVTRMLRLTLPPGTRINEGDGVWLDARNTPEPRHIVTSVQYWPLCVCAMIERRV